MASLSPNASLPANGTSPPNPMLAGTDSLLAFFVAVAFLGLLWYTISLIRKYSSPRNLWVYIIAVFLSWFLGFMGLLLMPLDLAEYEDGKESLILLWQFVYWSTFLLSWGVCPVLLYCWQSGEFTWKKRLVFSLKSNLKYYAVVVALAVVFSIIIAATNGFTFGSLRGFLIALANVYGLLLIILLLGFGIVDVPRRLWQLSSLEGELRRLEFRAPEVEDHHFEVSVCVPLVVCVLWCTVCTVCVLCV